MLPEAGAIAELLEALVRAEGRADQGDIPGARSALAQFDLVLRQLRADDLDDGVARELHARLGALAARFGASRDRVFAELDVARRTRAYGAPAPGPGRRVEDRA